MDFKDLREEIEFLIEEANKWVEKKSISESSEKHSKAQNLLIKLRAMAENDIQERSVLRLATELEYLGEKIDDILSKREAGKKEDGNIAFKSNWNDKKYKNICSQGTYEYNIDQGRAWCSSAECRCRSFKKEPTLKDHPCYESIALKELYFGAGWDHTGERNMPRTIKSVRQGRMAILTTRPPDWKKRVV